MTKRGTHGKSSGETLTVAYRSELDPNDIATRIPEFVVRELAISKGDVVIWDVMRGVDSKMGVFKLFKKANHA